MADVTNPPDPPKTEVTNRGLVVRSIKEDEEVEIKPEDFFRDFKNYLTETLNNTQSIVSDSKGILSATQTKHIQDAHADLSNAMSQFSTLLESNMMDLRFLTQLPDTNLFYIVNRCEWKPLDKKFISNHQDALKAQFRIADDDLYPSVIKCTVASVWDLIKSSDKKYFIVSACLFHHYQIENLSYVSILSRTRILVEDGDKDFLMFIYLLKRGL
jgi:hypothetical protein